MTCLLLVVAAALVMVLAAGVVSGAGADGWSLSGISMRGLCQWLYDHNHKKIDTRVNGG
jgi:hypothetical protein